MSSYNRRNNASLIRQIGQFGSMLDIEMNKRFEQKFSLSLDYMKGHDEEVARFLANDDPETRSLALQFLFQYCYNEKIKETLINLARSDPANCVKTTAISLIGILRLAKENDEDKRCARTLLDIIQDSQQSDEVKSFAYVALIPYERNGKINIPAHFRFPEDVNWGLLEQVNLGSCRSDGEVDPKI